MDGGHRQAFGGEGLHVVENQVESLPVAEHTRLMSVSGSVDGLGSVFV
jgi:hypothetical protein